MAVSHPKNILFVLCCDKDFKAAIRRCALQSKALLSVYLYRPHIEKLALGYSLRGWRSKLRIWSKPPA